MPKEDGKISAGVEDVASWLGDPDRLSVQRAVGEIRAGRPVKLLGQGGDNHIVAAAEMLGGENVISWHAATDGAVGLVLPAPRLLHLGFVAQGPARLELAGLKEEDVDAMLLAVAPRVPVVPLRPALDAEIAALELVKRAYLLPAAIVLPAGSNDSGTMVEVSATAIERFHELAAQDLAIAARTRVPLADSVDTEFVVFRGGDGLHDQLAIVIGDPDPGAPVLTRLHSACLTGDLFGSLKCDCGDQLRLAVGEIADEGSGVLLYLDQEGRGIGLLNKMRAYGLQELGHDTVDADAVLGYGPDERRYEVAGAMLSLLGFRKITLMTNNLGKITALESFGVDVVGHRRLIGPVNPHNHNYLTTKAERAGHLLGEIARHGGRK
ncbi:MAG: GTP cyclohydrolase II RibA [Rhodospirillaceae bacterium]